MTPRELSLARNAVARAELSRRHGGSWYFVMERNAQELDESIEFRVQQEEVVAPS